ncbi:flagellar export protein FliJ [Candidatus Enterovibrio escicola]|uniref:Flagellar FliJ protein n=1 Tax=Candidatus Enterovibrio escicola TaxID=1927127 RepID=A0A2A5T1I9_9GAMM|nr:flagellar export protein FliJ [Candidatus Enterovibrio escacola]PCS21990.1 Flagellar protein FliJ [Candidatus Enterovibrio escacola]
MSENTMLLLLKQDKNLEYQAYLALVSAQQELQSYYKQLEEIERYRLDYFSQMLERGKIGLSSSSFGHLNRFIIQLDKTLAKQHQGAIYFEDNVERCREHWQHCLKKTRSLEWLIEKCQKEAKIRAERLEQKQLDEFSMLIFIRKQHKSY